MSSYYMRQGYAIIAKDGDETGHWFGGEPYHKGSQCPVCKVPRRSQISIATGGRVFLEENLSGSPKTEARAGAVVE